MRKYVSIALVLLMIFSLWACGGQSSSGKDSGLQAGFGREKILPKKVTDAHIAGSDAANRVATGYLDELCVTCIALKEGKETVLIYTMDVINAFNSVVKAAKKAITERTGVPADRIVMNATHTHSGVAMTYDWDGVVEYNLMFNEAVAKAAETAIADLSAAQVYSGMTLVSQTYTGKAMKEGLEKLAGAREVAEVAAAYGNSNGITVSLAAKYGFDSV